MNVHAGHTTAQEGQIASTGRAVMSAHVPKDTEESTGSVKVMIK